GAAPQWREDNRCCIPLPLAPTSMLAGKHLPDPPRRDPARAPARYRLEQPMDRLHHDDLTIRNCRAGAQGPKNAANARKLMVLTVSGGPERSRVCRRLVTRAGVSAVSERPGRSALGQPSAGCVPRAELLEHRARVARDHQILVGRDYP